MADRGLRAAIAQAGPIPLQATVTCEPGQVLALFGPSGSGKTTVLRTIAGLYTPRQAIVTMDGEAWGDTDAGVHMPTHQRRVGFVFQDHALFPHLSALGNVTAALGHRPRAEREARARALLELVQLQGRVDRRPAAMSGGERQRVAVARALARDPRILLLDEPFSAVDRGLRRALHGEIDAIRDAVDIPIVLVTHDFEDVLRLATHLAIIRTGEVVAQGPLTDLTGRPDLPWLRDAVGLGAVLEATVARVDVPGGLAELDAAGTTLVASRRDLEPGHRVRVRIPARDVILARTAPEGLSVHNVLRATVAGLTADPGAGAVVVRLAVGRVSILAEVTRDAVTRLGMIEGGELYALIKSVSLEVLSADTRPRSAESHHSLTRR